MNRDKKDIVVGLDIGTSKTIALVAEIDLEGSLNIIGTGVQDSNGLIKGVVSSIEKTVATIDRVVREVALMADCEVREVYTGIAGSHIKSFNSNGIVAVKDKEVTQMDVERAIETAKAMPIPADQEILHILTQEFIIDEQDGIREPIGLTGHRLEVKVHIVTGAVSAAQNIVKCVRRCGMEVVDLVLQPLASSYAVLSEDEKDLGICLIDIGGGTTDIAVWTQGAIRYTHVIPIAGDQVTNDIAMAFHTPRREAEEIKRRFGCALSELADHEDVIDVAGVDDRPSRKLSRRVLADVIEPRVEELFELVQAELRRSGFEEILSSGIVLTGGSSVMPGMIELGEEVFHMPVRLGIPKYGGALADVVRSPRYSTAYGLLLEAQAQKKRGRKVRETHWGLKQVFDRMRSWFEKNF
ncbi:MAG: cell division protein FtsA [Candidatus Accumulibacter sp.]|jgi:cell division protein FtsA|nr:cell division protein FtsA [Accumulibacter sp.]